jgi:hypothetical protein
MLVFILKYAQKMNFVLKSSKFLTFLLKNGKNHNGGPLGFLKFFCFVFFSLRLGLGAWLGWYRYYNYRHFCYNIIHIIVVTGVIILTTGGNSTKIMFNFNFITEFWLALLGLICNLCCLTLIRITNTRNSFIFKLWHILYIEYFLAK